MSGTIQVSLVALPLLPWLLKNFLIPHRSIKLSLDPLLGYQREERLYFLNRQRKRCTRSKQLCSIRWLCWFKSSGSVVSSAWSRVASSMTIFSGQSVISRVYTSRFGNGTVSLEPQPRWYWKKYQVLYPVETPPKVNHTEPYRAVPCSGKAP